MPVRKSGIDTRAFHFNYLIDATVVFTIGHMHSFGLQVYAIDTEVGQLQFMSQPEYVDPQADGGGLLHRCVYSKYKIQKKS